MELLGPLKSLTVAIWNPAGYQSVPGSDSGVRARKIDEEKKKTIASYDLTRSHHPNAAPYLLNVGTGWRGVP